MTSKQPNITTHVCVCATSVCFVMELLLFTAWTSLISFLCVTTGIFRRTGVYRITVKYGFGCVCMDVAILDWKGRFQFKGLWHVFPVNTRQMVPHQQIIYMQWMFYWWQLSQQNAVWYGTGEEMQSIPSTRQMSSWHAHLL